MTVRLTLEGGSAELTRVDGERFTILATLSAAPGTPLRAVIEGTSEALELKVARCIRRSDAAFEVEGRLVNLTRVQRSILAQRLP
ncbi:MAG: hypothetical protein FJ096_17330 [Deltaproteobacteria bacterium]|nr:hypothetical protein [Deltaproteobacteria bacterium]